MTTTDHAIVAPAVTGDPGTRADAGGFDPGRAYATRDGRKVLGLRPMPISGFIGKVGGEEYQWWARGCYVSGKTHPLDLVNVGVRPAAPDPIPQPEGDTPPAPAANHPEFPESSISRQDAIASQERYLEQIRNDPLGIDPVMIALAERKLAQMRSAPPAPAQSAGAAADGEDDAAWLAASVFIDALWDYVEPHREEDYPRVKALSRQRDGAKAALRDALARHAARPHEPADVSARSARSEVAEAVLVERAKGVLTWLDGALQCKSWRWDADQRECAQMEADALRKILARPTPAAVLDRARPVGQGEGDWQSIETAPKDGTKILCYYSDLQCVAVLRYEQNKWLDDKDTIFTTPTHWQRLPSLPSSTQTYGAGW